jgi:hypothetical protein
MWQRFPTMMQLFELFWSFHILRDIMNETNRYAISRTKHALSPNLYGILRSIVGKRRAGRIWHT